MASARRAMMMAATSVATKSAGTVEKIAGEGMSIRYAAVLVAARAWRM